MYSRIKLRKEHCELFFKEIYNAYVNSLDENDRAEINESDSDSWKKLFKPSNLYSFGNELSFANNFDRIPLENVSGVSLNDMVLEIHGSSNTEYRKDYCEAISKYLYDKFREYENSSKDFLVFGGGNKLPYKYYGQIFFWYIGCKNHQDFLEKCNVVNDEIISSKAVGIDLYSTLNRKGEWKDDAWEKLSNELEGKWQFEGFEEKIPYRDMKKKPKKLVLPEGYSVQDYVNHIQGDSIAYDRRFCYSFYVHLKKSNRPGLLLLEGKIYEDIEGEDGIFRRPDINDEKAAYWKFSAICSVRHPVVEEVYLNLDFELIPENIPKDNLLKKPTRTFGQAMLNLETRFKHSAFGFYLSSRFGTFDKTGDKKFHKGFKIAFGRCAMQKIE